MIENIVFALVMVAIVFLGFYYRQDISKYVKILQDIIKKQNNNLKKIKKKRKKCGK